jgi:hypothetical protein
VDPGTSLSTAYRVYSSLDLVPNAWATLLAIGGLYTPAPRCPSYVRDIVNVGIKSVGSVYVQVGDTAQGSAVELTGQLVPSPHWWGIDPTGTALFAYQVAQQHDPATYMGLLLQPPTVGAVVKLAAMRTLIAAPDVPEPSPPPGPSELAGGPITPPPPP